MSGKRKSRSRMLNYTKIKSEVFVLFQNVSTFVCVFFIVLD